MIKLIVSDMDGTLLDDNKNLPPNFIETYELLQKANIEFAIASGRPYYSLKLEFAHFKNNITYIADNGAYIGTKPQAIVNDSISIDQLLPLIEEARNYPEITLVICTEDIAYIEAKEWSTFTTVYQYYRNLAMVDDLTHIGDGILKVAIYNSDKWDSLEKYNFGGLTSTLNFALSGDYWLDIMPLGIDKGNALEQLQQALNVSPEETMVFGDFLNDLEMMKCAKHSYAMDNAHPDIKKAANYIAPSNNNYGVTEIINKEVL